MIKKRGRFSGGGFLEDIKEIRKVSDKTLQVGWFEGTHEPSGMSYASLAAYHANGGDGNNQVFVRDVLGLLISMEKVSPSPKVKEVVDRWLSSPKKTDVLKELGDVYVEKIKDLFGSEFLIPTEYNPDPLIDTGELKGATEARIKQ